MISPVSGGGLLGGVSAALKARSGGIRVVGAEPELLPHYRQSLAAGDASPSAAAHRGRRSSRRRRALKTSPSSRPIRTSRLRFGRIYQEGMKLMLTEGKLLAEPASCIGAGALLEGASK
ncbi:MAG: hypothetical protein ACLUEQ_00100 [Cloacibacillus evryensis]